MNKDKYITKLKKLSYPKLVKRAWKVWSEKRRKETADHRGYVACITCGVVKHWKELQAGHFRHNHLDFHIKNINPQCVHCNKFLHGNLGNYAIWLDKTYGFGTAESLKLMASKEKDRPCSKDELIQIIFNN